MKPDILNRKDIEKFIRVFYEKVQQDTVIGFIFNVVVQMNWEKHIPLIVDFWESILLDHPVYKKNAMEVHYALNKKVPLQKEHFERWLQLFNESIDEFYEGKITDLAKTRARSIAHVMFYKMNDTSDKLSVK